MRSYHKLSALAAILPLSFLRPSHRHVPLKHESFPFHGAAGAPTSSTSSRYPDRSSLLATKYTGPLDHLVLSQKRQKSPRYQQVSAVAHRNSGSSTSKSSLSSLGNLAAHPLGSSSGPVSYNGTCLAALFFYANGSTF